MGEGRRLEGYFTTHSTHFSQKPFPLSTQSSHSISTHSSLSTLYSTLHSLLPIHHPPVSFHHSPLSVPHFPLHIPTSILSKSTENHRQLFTAISPVHQPLAQPEPHACQLHTHICSLCAIWDHANIFANLFFLCNATLLLKVSKALWIFRNVGIELILQLISLIEIVLLLVKTSLKCSVISLGSSVEFPWSPGLGTAFFSLRYVTFFSVL